MFAPEIDLATLSGSSGRWQLSHQGQLTHQGHSARLDHDSLAQASLPLRLRR